MVLRLLLWLWPPWLVLWLWLWLCERLSLEEDTCLLSSCDDESEWRLLRTCPLPLPWALPMALVPALVPLPAVRGDAPLAAAMLDAVSCRPVRAFLVAGPAGTGGKDSDPKSSTDPFSSTRPRIRDTRRYPATWKPFASW